VGKSSYVNGETVTLTEFGPSNLGSSPATCRLQVWVSAPSIGIVTLIDVGSDGTFALPANTDLNFGPMTLFTVSATFPPKGSWSFNSKVTNPTTGAILSEDLNPFTIQ
jgi:hypothetical protein